MKRFEVGRGKKRPLTPSHSLIHAAMQLPDGFRLRGSPSRARLRFVLVVCMFLRLGSGVVTGADQSGGCPEQPHVRRCMHTAWH